MKKIILKETNDKYDMDKSKLVLNGKTYILDERDLNDRHK